MSTAALALVIALNVSAPFDWLAGRAAADRFWEAHADVLVTHGPMPYHIRTRIQYRGFGEPWLAAVFGMGLREILSKDVRRYTSQQLYDRGTLQEVCIDPLEYPLYELRRNTTGMAWKFE